MDLVYGSALWFTSTRVTCHHLAERLALEGPTLFVESVGARAPRVHDWRRIATRIGRSLRPLRQVGPQLWVFSPLPLPAYSGTGAAVNSRWVGRQVRTLLALRRWTVDASWIFHPMGLGTADQARARGTIYYCVDDYAANPGVDRTSVRRLEASLAGLANLTITTAEPLAVRLRPLARRVEVLPNVTDTDLFLGDVSAVRHPVLEALDALRRPRLGYLGNLAAYKIDVELIHEIARRRPQWSLALVGPMNRGDVRSGVTALGSPPNVHWLGEVPHSVAPAVIERFDVALLPSAQHEVMQASFPLKFFEYLLRGKPVVARPLPALEPFREWLDLADDAAGFVAAAERRLVGDSAELAARRRAFAARFAWTERIVGFEQLRRSVVG